MNITRVGNDILDNGDFTVHPCARCVAFWGDGEYRYLGQVGCRMPVVDDLNERLYREWIVKDDKGGEHGYLKCFRCFNTNQDCCSVPEELRDELEEVVLALKRVRDKGHFVVVPNPAYRPLSPGAPETEEEVPKTLRQFKTYTDDEVELAMMKMSRTCKDISKTLNSRQYAPHSAHLYLHNGSTNLDEDPNAEVKPNGRVRTVKAAASRQEYLKRSFDQSVAARLQEDVEQADTPRKKSKKARVVIDPAAERDRERARLSADLADATAKRAVEKDKVQKGVLTKRVKSLTAKLMNFG